MLKLTKKADYGLIALRHLASSPGQMSSTKEIAEAYHLPVPLLAKVLQTLKKARLLVSVPGRTVVTSCLAARSGLRLWKLSRRSMGP